MSNLRAFKKGEHIYREGERPLFIYLIQSGLVSVYLTKAKKNIELYQATTTQVLGEEGIFGAKQMSASAVAINDTQAIEIPVDVMKGQIEGGAQMLRLLLKSLGEKQKNFTTELKSFKQERDTSPCPQENVAKVFGVIYHTANYTGTKKESRVSVNWANFKRYAQRVFLESPLRLEHAVYILVKLKMAELQMIKNETDPEAPDELGFVHFSKLPTVEKFFEFYQNYYFKGGNLGILKVDEKTVQMVEALVKVSDGAKSDRTGVVMLNYKETVDKMKEILGPSFSGDHLTRVEQKGLFLKRQSSEKGGTLSFYRNEFMDMLENWKILREIDKWNEQGFVDPKESEAKIQGGKKLVCPSCQTAFQPQQKFCAQCGYKLDLDKAA